MQGKASMAQLALVNEILSPQSSFAKLRERIATANPPVIPYVGQ
jgi:hypothetical protein